MSDGNINTIESVLEELTSIYKVVDEVLASWSGDGNIQFPSLIGMVAVKLNLNDKQVRELDPMVRFFVRKHPDWYVTRGAHGGIMRVSDKQKKEAAKTNKSLIKEQLKAAIEAKVSQAADSAKDQVDAQAENNSIEQE